MPEEAAAFIFDVRGILAWSRSSGNQFSAVRADVDSGEVCVFSCVYNEFCKAYDDQAPAIIQLGIKRLQQTEEHSEAAVAIAEGAQATFGFRGPYDSSIEWQVAGIACCDGLTIVTDAKTKAKYNAIDGVNAITFEEFLDRH